MEQNSFFKKHLNTIIFFLKGMLMGAADVVPGVSGGTIAFITNIYERLISGIAQISKATTTLIKKPNKTNLTNLIKRTDWLFFIPLGLGLLTSLKLFSNLITNLLTTSPGELFSFFTGLILASAVVLILKIKHNHKLKNIAYLLIAAIITYFLTGLSSTTLPSNPITLFLSGTIAICAMILPGISGSYLLLVLGQYETVITAIHELNFLIIIIFGLGAITGLLAFSRVLKHLLHKHHDLMIYILTGVMLGALRVPATEVLASTVSLTSGVIYFVIGAAVVALLQLMSLKKSD